MTIKLKYNNLSAPLIFEGDIFKKMHDYLETGHSNDIWSSDPYDIYKDTNGDIIIEFDLEGIEQKDISVNVSGQTLKVETKAQEKEQGEFYHRKISRRALKKQFTLHQDVDKESIEAEYKNGLLKIKIPLEKKEKRDIMIQVK